MPARSWAGITSLGIMKENLNNLRKETETALRVLYALKQFRFFVSTQETVDKLNENADFWLIYETSVRTHLFISIRRLYEGKPGTFNFQGFINNCITNIDDFNRDALRKRKESGSSSAKEWIDEYMQDTYEPLESDFRELSKIVRENSKKMKGIYTDAASKIYAHAIHLDHASIASITDKLEFDEMESALLSIWHCYDQVWQMYQNGRKPDLIVGKYPYEQEVYDSLTKQLG